MKNTNIESLYEKAVEVIAKTRRASLTHLQWRLEISYQEAAQLLDLLEERGIIGPASDTAPREILIG